LDQGLRPRDMNISVEGILHEPGGQTEDLNDLDGVKVDELSLKDE
jgi:hypothetical protein